MALIAQHKHLEIPPQEFIVQSFPPGFGSAPQFQGKTWTGKILKADTRHTLPICWHAGSLRRAFGSNALADFDDTFISEFGDFVFMPKNFFGKKGSVVRVPRAVLITGKGSNDPAFVTVDAQDILLDVVATLREDLDKLGIMVANVKPFACFDSEDQPLAFALPYEMTELAQSFSDDLGTHEFGVRFSLAEKFAGGEVLMIADVTALWGGYLAYQSFIPGPGPEITSIAYPLTDILQRNDTEVRASHPLFARIEKNIAKFDFPESQITDPDFPYAEAVGLGASLLQGGCSALASYGLRYYDRGQDTADARRAWYSNMVPQLIRDFFNF